MNLHTVCYNLLGLFTQTNYSMLSIHPTRRLSVSRRKSAIVPKVQHENKWICPSSSLLYRPIKRHNWSVPVQPLAQKSQGAQKPQKTGRAPDIVRILSESEYYPKCYQILCSSDKDAWSMTL